MKIAAISDIHGNLAALEAVLADIRTQGVDLVVNLGDIVSGPLQPLQTADRLMPLGFPTIRGNHERQLLSGDRAHMGASDRWAFDCLRTEHIEWMANLPATLVVEDDILLVHGTANDDLTYFLETVEETGCRGATRAEVNDRVGGTPCGLILCGHTHIPRFMKLDDRRLVVNPGSVGLQAYDDERPFPHRMEAGSPHARYALLRRRSAEWHVDFRAVPYDWEAAAVLALSNGRQEWSCALRTGFCRSD